MASRDDQSVVTPTPNQYAERLLPYMQTYPAQGSCQASFIKAWVVILGGMVRNPQLGRPGYRRMPPCLTSDAVLIVDDSVNPNAFITSDWWGYWGPVLPALIKFLLPVAMDGTGTWPHPRTDGQFNEACRRSMEESFVQDPKSSYSVCENDCQDERGLQPRMGPGHEPIGRVQHHGTHHDRPRPRTATGEPLHGGWVVSIHQ